MSIARFATLFLLLVEFAVPSPLRAQDASAPYPQDPPLVHWQRTLADALQLSKKLRAPLLVVANMDGETACEQLVRVHYRKADFAALANRYVAVIGARERHNPRDYDDRGRRIPCPRFGCVTCGEHIAIEPELFAKYFKGRGVAPRHIGISPDGKELFDRFLDRSLDNVYRALRDNAKQDAALRVTSADRSIAGLAKSVAHRDRAELEGKFAEGNAAQRRAILQGVATGGVWQPDVLEQALRVEDHAVREAAVLALDKTVVPDGLPVLLRAAGTATDDGQYRKLLATLERIAGTDKSCRRALVIRRALQAPGKIDPAAWERAYAAASSSGAVATVEVVPDEELPELDQRIESWTKKAKAGDPDGKLSLDIAGANLRYAINRMQHRKDPTFLLQDAVAAAGRAVQNGCSKAAAAPLLARAHWLLNDPSKASEQAALAVESPGLVPAASPTSAAVLDIYARHQADLVRAVGNDLEKEFPAAAASNAHAAYRALAHHPAATEAQLTAHVVMLWNLGAQHEAMVALRAALRRFPAAGSLHTYLRTHVQWRGGDTALATAYDGFDTTPEGKAAIEWFAGYAILKAANAQVSARQYAAARQLYGKAVRAFESSAAANQDYRDSALQYCALAHGGAARAALDSGAFDAALESVAAGLKAHPSGMEAKDELGNSIGRTARRLRRHLEQGGKVELVARLDKLLEEHGKKE
ncbi:MAG: hypothetical protein KDC87_18355 [Planctomycetes bacterium]|nr:hypothetical protein [Planctomycetota bacterium]